MARKVGYKRKNIRGTAPGLPGKHRSTGFLSRDELKRRKQGNARAFIGFFLLILVLLVVNSLGSLW
ncbi:MAG: hypothetical protein KDD66_18030 [Bdellovibrionales bacterium]|nr:hypothetical protein [Bdellovibrionales bacterium]